MLGARWGETDPRAGFAFAENARKNTRRALIENITARWAAIDPTAAVAWLNAKPGDHTREAALSSIIAELSRRDPAGALSLLQALPQTPSSIEAHDDPFFRDVQFNALANRWIKADPDVATKWIQSTDQLPADLKTKLLAPR